MLNTLENNKLPSTIEKQLKKQQFIFNDFFKVTSYGVLVTDTKTDM